MKKYRQPEGHLLNKLKWKTKNIFKKNGWKERGRLVTISHDRKQGFVKDVGKEKGSLSKKNGSLHNNVARQKRKKGKIKNKVDCYGYNLH